MFIDLVCFQVEGMDAVLDRVCACKVSSITLAPLLFVETGSESDVRLPPLDLDGQKRELERPLWGGATVKYGRRHLAFEFDETLYRDTPYRLKWQVDEEDFCQRVIAAARARGLKVNLTLPSKPLQPLEQQDCPHDAFGAVHLAQISRKGCINSPQLRAFYLGTLLNLWKRYRPDGILIDWIEYTDYFFSDNLVCFCPHCERAAVARGVDFAALRAKAQQVFRWVKEQVKVPQESLNGWSEIWEAMSPGISQLFDFKAGSCCDYVSWLRKQVNEFGAGEVTLIFPGFAPPMNVGTGFHYQKLNQAASGVLIQPKGYRFHWGMMVRWYADELARLNKKVAAPAWVPFVRSMLEVEQDASLSYQDYRMPEPTEWGPISLECEYAKLEQARSSVTGSHALSFRLHGYGPLEMFKKRIAYAKKSGYDSIHVQRYGYTGNAKLDLLAGLRESSPVS